MHTDRNTGPTPRCTGLLKCEKKKTKKKTRAGVCKTLCPQLPNSNTARLQHCLPMMVTTVQIYEISTLFYQNGNNYKPEIAKGNNSNISFNWFKI